MIRKVLELFRDRTESVFLNLSAYDISSEASRSMLYELLSNLPQEACGRITFEILESEKIRDFNEMVNFLNEIRKFGVKIAIDDFGAGFSNFTAILRVNPDFIKIDGDQVPFRFSVRHTERSRGHLCVPGNPVHVHRRHRKFPSAGV